MAQLWLGAFLWSHQLVLGEVCIVPRWQQLLEPPLWVGRQNIAVREVQGQGRPPKKVSTTSLTVVDPFWIPIALLPGPWSYRGPEGLLTNTDTAEGPPHLGRHVGCNIHQVPHSKSFQLSVFWAGRIYFLAYPEVGWPHGTSSGPIGCEHLMTYERTCHEHWQCFGQWLFIFWILAWILQCNGPVVAM